MLSLFDFLSLRGGILGIDTILPDFPFCARALCFLQNRFKNIFFDEIGVRVRKFFLLEEVLRRVSAAAIK